MAEDFPPNHFKSGSTWVTRFLSSCIFSGERASALEWVASMYDRCLDIPPNLEALLLEYWKEGNEEALIAAALMAVRQFYFDPEQQVKLIAWLVENRQLGIEEAVSLLIFSSVISDGFSSELRHVIDVAWLVNQDKNSGIMNPQQDPLLADALRNICVSDPRLSIANPVSGPLNQ